jgi:DNA-directed RNA polymerase specialized sigma24 family protein
MPVQSVCEVAAQLSPDAHWRAASLNDLCAEARLQEHHYLGGLPSHDTAGVELFRRAIDERDSQAWAAVIELYRGLLIGQAGRQVIRGFVSEDDGFCTDRAFQRFWRATRSRGMHQFSDLASILKYLKMCLVSVLLDEARARKRQPGVPIDDVPPEAHMSGDPAAIAVGHSAERDLWRAVDNELRDDAERLIARLSFVHGLTPREIRARCPAQFADIDEVYRLKRLVIERLRRSEVLQRLRD